MMNYPADQMEFEEMFNIDEYVFRYKRQTSTSRGICS